MQRKAEKPRRGSSARSVAMLRGPVFQMLNDEGATDG